MWAHYAVRHTGFLIGFDASQNILDRPTPIFHHFDAVSYCHHRATGGRFTHIPDKEIYFRKSSEWAYEREWRVVESIMAIDGDVDDPKANWPFPIVTESIKTVVVGHRGAWVLPKVLALLKEDRYPHATLQFAIPDLRTFRLNLHDWPRDQWNEKPPYPLEMVVPQE
jgi:hypothetical protein